MKISHVAAVAVLIVATGGASSPAQAAGCNGVVNPFVWYCAPWDNNNGPKYPYYQAPRVVIPRAKARVETLNGAQFVTDLRNNQRMPLIGQDGASLVAAGGGN